MSGIWPKKTIVRVFVPNLVSRYTTTGGIGAKQPTNVTCLVHAVAEGRLLAIVPMNSLAKRESQLGSRTVDVVLTNQSDQGSKGKVVCSVIPTPPVFVCSCGLCIFASVLSESGRSRSIFGRKSW